MPAMIGSGVPEERRRPHGHPISGQGKGPAGNKKGVEREMEGLQVTATINNYRRTSNNSRYDMDMQNEDGVNHKTKRTISSYVRIWSKEPSRLYKPHRLPNIGQNQAGVQNPYHSFD
jgi:hypothetical protein